MAKNNNKTQKNAGNVEDFLATVEHEQKLADSRVILQMMEEISGEKPVMWGGSIVGFGSYSYKYKSGREGEWMLVGFSPRKTALTLYLMSGLSNFEEELDQLGKHKRSKGCLYIKRLSDINSEVLRAMLEKNYRLMLERKKIAE